MRKQGNMKTKQRVKSGKVKTLVINTSYKTQELCTIQGKKNKTEKFS